MNVYCAGPIAIRPYVPQSNANLKRLVRSHPGLHLATHRWAAVYAEDRHLSGNPGHFRIVIFIFQAHAKREAPPDFDISNSDRKNSRNYFGRFCIDGAAFGAL